MAKLKLNPEAPTGNEENSFRFKPKEEKIQEELEKNMQMNAISVDLSEEQLKKSKKHYKDLKIKRITLYVVLLVTFLSIVIFGANKTFFDHKYTGQEIANLANYYNGQTNFPTYGLQGYLDKNIDVLLKSKITVGPSVTDVKISSPVITKINEKSSTLVNVYFYVDIVSNIGTSETNCVIPIIWDYKNSVYAPGGTVIFTPNQSTVIDTEKQDNPMLSFENVTKEDAKVIDSSKVFVTNFFTMLYSGQDISPYSKGLKLDVDKTMSYNYMSEYTLYKTANVNGYNAYAKITLTLSNGLNYTTEKYLTIEKSGESWIITAIL